MKRYAVTERGLSLVELLVAVAIVAVLVAILLPVSTSMIEKGKTAVCVSHLRAIGGAFGTYIADNNGECPYGADNIGSYPPDGAGKTYNELLIPYLDANALPRTPAGERVHHKFFDCPTVAKDPAKGFVFYGFYSWNSSVLTVRNVSSQTALKAAQMTSPANTLLLGCSPMNQPGRAVEWANLANWAEIKEENMSFGYYHPGNSCNFLMADGHVEAYRYDIGVPPFSAHHYQTGMAQPPEQNGSNLF